MHNICDTAYNRTTYLHKRILKATNHPFLWYILVMNPETILSETASLFLALGDKTRLRLLNLMRDREVCVSSFIDTLGESQPLISRHLAYLRNSGIVEARRDGKWMHYSVSANLDDNTGKLLFELFRWMEGQGGLRLDREKYQEVYPSHATPTIPEKKPKDLPTRPRQRREPTYENQPEEISIHHNELEDFLL